MFKHDLPDLFVIPKWYKNLFFVKRRPKFRFARDWPPPELAALENDKPQTEEERQAKAAAQELYDRRLADEGFISPFLFADPSEITSDLRTDLRELQQYLLPRFWAFDQEARYYQNLYYLYQWVFILGAFLTTLLGASSVLLYQRAATDSVTNGFGIAATVIGALTGTISFLETRQSPQRRWFQARTKAERLRSLYFLFLARQKPFDQADAKQRLKDLRVMILNILKRRSDEDEQS